MLSLTTALPTTTCQAASFQARWAIAAGCGDITCSHWRRRLANCNRRERICCHSPSVKRRAARDSKAVRAAASKAVAGFWVGDEEWCVGDMRRDLCGLAIARMLAGSAIWKLRRQCLAWRSVLCDAESGFTILVLIDRSQNCRPASKTYASPAPYPSGQESPRFKNLSAPGSARSASFPRGTRVAPSHLDNSS
jgi:hypothetical protein